jgi:signal transduction histidine kinase
MAEPKERVTSAIVAALANLDEALAELEKIPTFDARSATFTAHALNNYLTVTTGTLELALSRLAKHPDEELRVWLEGAQHASTLMARLVSQLIDTAAPGDAPYRIESFDMPMLVQRACRFYQREADRKGSRIIVESAAGVPPVSADRVAVAAILENLVSNAIKFSPPGATIHVQIRGERDWVVCAVRDNGPGLNAEDHAKLFQRGARLTPKPTAGEHSAGFGLAVAKELVESLGGQIWCESAVGRGSCFTFRLPAHRNNSPGPAPAPPDDLTQSSGKPD